jgi:hypothetical protein
MQSLRTEPAIINADGLAEYNQDHLYWHGGEPLPARQCPRLTPRQLTAPRPEFLAACRTADQIQADRAERARLMREVHAAMDAAGFHPVMHRESISIAVGNEFLTVEFDTFPRLRTETRS